MEAQMETARAELRIVGASQPCVQYFVDEEDLGKRVCRALGEAGVIDALPWFGADYDLEDTVLGEKMGREGAEGAILLACGCGHSGCSSVRVDVMVTETTIVWSRFWTWWEGRMVVAAIPAVNFERRGFEEAVGGVRAEMARWKPAPVSG